MKSSLIKQIKIIWSESGHINYTLGSDESGEINKTVSPEMFDLLAKESASFKTTGGYDKTKVEVIMNDSAVVLTRIDITKEWSTFDEYLSLYW